MAREKSVACMFCVKAPCECHKPVKKVSPPKVVKAPEPAPPPPVVPAPRRPSFGSVRMVRPATKAQPVTRTEPPKQPTKAAPKIVRPAVTAQPSAARPKFTNVKRVSTDPAMDAALDALRAVFEVEILRVEDAPFH